MKKTTKETGRGTRGKSGRAASPMSRGTNRKETAMADETSNNADFIGRVVGDAKNPPETRMLSGWFGDSGEEGYRRLYTDAELSSYVDIPDDAILYTEPIRDAQPAGAVLVWIRRDAAVKQGGSAFSRAARFLQGQVQQDFASGAGAASGLDVEKAGFHCVTQVPCGEVTGFTGKCTNEPQVGGAWPCITAPPHCYEVTGFTGKCTHQPWPNPTRYIGCTIFHCPTNDLTHIPHICNLVATGLPGCGGVNPPDKGGDPAALRGGASEEASADNNEAAAPATSLPGCGYTKTWGLCETHLLGCGQTKDCPTTMPGCGQTNDCPTTMPGCGWSRNPICTDLPGCGFTKNFGACQTQAPKCQPSVQVPCITPSFSPTQCCPDGTNVAAQAQQNFTPATVCTQIGCQAQQNFTPATVCTQIGCQGGGGNQTPATVCTQIGCEGPNVGSPRSALVACNASLVGCPSIIIDCLTPLLHTRIGPHCWPVPIFPGPIVGPGPVNRAAGGGVQFGAAAQQDGGASQICATNIACNVTLFCGQTLGCPAPAQGGGQGIVVSAACTDTKPPTSIEGLCTQAGPPCPTYCGPDCQTKQPNCTHFNCPTDQQECTQNGTFCTRYVGCPGYTQSGCPPTPGGPICPNTDARIDCTFGCTQIGPACPQITTDVVCNTINQPQAFAAQAIRPVPVTQGAGCPASDFVACSQFGGCPTQPNGDCTFFNCPSLQQAAAGPAVCTQSGPQCPTHQFPCTSAGHACPPTPGIICTQVGPQCPRTHLGQCPSPGIDCTVVVCTHVGPLCPPQTKPPQCPQLTPLCPTGLVGCPPPHTVQGPACQLLTAPPQCPVHSGFNCPSAVGCQSIACQSVACHPQGGGQQQQFGAAAHAIGFTPNQPTPATHCFVCPPFDQAAARNAGPIHPTLLTQPVYVCNPSIFDACPTRICTHQILQCNPSVIDACPTRICTHQILQCNPSILDACPTRLCTQQFVQCNPSAVDLCPTRIGCPTRSPQLCPVATGFNCPSAVGCQSVACQSIACQPGGGGQQQQQPQPQQFAAAAGGFGVSSWDDCTHFGCPPFFTQFEQECVVQPWPGVTRFGVECQHTVLGCPPPPPPPPPTPHCPPRSHFVICTRFGPQCPPPVVAQGPVPQGRGGIHPTIWTQIGPQCQGRENTYYPCTQNCPLQGITFPAWICNRWE